MSERAPSAAVLDHLRSPRHAGAFPPGEVGVRTGEAGDLEQGRLVRFQLRPFPAGSGGGGVREARFKAFGCAATIASASWLSEQVSGQPEERARVIEPAEIARALDLSPGRRSAAELAVRALRAALAATPAHGLSYDAPRAERGGPMSSEPKSQNITWSHSQVTAEQRRALTGHGAVTVWFTGLSGSGKSTVATSVERQLVEHGRHAYVLDGDNIRHGLNSNVGFSPEDRTENIRRIGEVAKLFNDAGVIVLTAFVSPYRADRDRVRETLPEATFVEVLVDCPLDECERRDVKGLYKKARTGEIAEFTGISAPFEAPEKPEIVLATAESSVEECAQQVLDYLAKNDVIPAQA